MVFGARLQEAMTFCTLCAVVMMTACVAMALPEFSGIEDTSFLQLVKKGEAPCQPTTTTGHCPKQVTTGWQCSMLLLNNGSVLSTGRNEYGQLGLGTNDTTSVSHWTLANVSNVIQVSARERYSPLFLHDDGTVSAVGVNECKQIGPNQDSITYNPFKLPGL
eukprot:TRINITY_DN5551_c0_g1_i2.p1 TRINITY_DN5551_c0_g1~~TRINITY_DN5551_c0_g1_i2.p1  ORF type:complete len:162 (-),score=21.70 TRINITY_DN5551_c0_g1_i2:908-1393(-)